MRREAKAIFQASVEAADPSRCIHQNVRLCQEVLQIGQTSYHLSDFRRIFVIGAGKASVPMAQAVEQILADRITRGVINTKYGHSRPLQRIEVNEAGHPLPDERGVEGTEKIVKLLKEADKETLVLCLLSGGGSALMPHPAAGISLEEKQQTTQRLLQSGASIEETNAIRKHLSGIKGGRLCQLAHPARVVTLILSDVVGNKLETIASGPTVADPSTFADCLRIVERYDLVGRLAPSVIRRLQAGVRGGVEETPKPGDRIFSSCQNLVVGDNRLAVEAARAKAISLGYNTLVLSTQIEGEAREVARVYAALAKEVLSSGNPVGSPACFIGGGETTVTVKGEGKGGRNQELVLAAAVQIDGLRDVVILSGGTDGTDGPTDAAGAVADGQTVRRAKQMGLSASDCLRENDSYQFFRALGDLLMTGPTGTNVMDIQIVLVR
ncbi:MAG: glycerate kinase [Candidatus Latescibacterota bacterium]|nr:MAG: glycerate kinase [Candidatus Latescibacterota bacterium]